MKKRKKRKEKIQPDEELFNPAGNNVAPLHVPLAPFGLA